MLAAEYTNGTKKRPASLDFTFIANGHRHHVSTVTVAGKAEARKLAAERGAKCWNF